MPALTSVKKVKVPFSMHMDSKLHKKLDRTSSKYDITKRQIVEQALLHYFSQKSLTLK